jgi:hypothetical protein
MLDLTVHVRQELGEWVISAVLSESHGTGLEPDVSTTSARLFVSGWEWSQDPLTAVRSALLRWLGVTSEGKRLQP